MATSRKRPSSGFTSKPEELPEGPQAEELDKFLENAVETILEEEFKEETGPINPGLPDLPEPPLFQMMEAIVPTEDRGPCVDLTEGQDVEGNQGILVTHRSPETLKKHPRNVPKFSRFANR